MSFSDGVSPYCSQRQVTESGHIVPGSAARRGQDVQCPVHRTNVVYEKTIPQSEYCVCTCNRQGFATRGRGRDIMRKRITSTPSRGRCISTQFSDKRREGIPLSQQNRQFTRGGVTRGRGGYPIYGGCRSRG